MFISGFTFIKNARKLDYPIEEAILSVLPLVNEMVVAVGDCDDDTRKVVSSLGEKIRIIDTVWDPELRTGGEVLAVETNKALDAIDPRTDWCIYIQGDECMHEKYHSGLKEAMHKHNNDERVEGLLFNYVHFYGSYDYVGDSRLWYRKEVRVFKNLPGVRSYRDAQGFRKNGKKLNVKVLDAAIYHYGWVRHPKYQMAKQLEANKLWHSDDYVKANYDASKDFDYSEIDSIKPFVGDHPEVMKDRIERMNWKFDRDPEIKTFDLKTRFLYHFEKLTGIRIGEYKNYRIV